VPDPSRTTPLVTQAASFDIDSTLYPFRSRWLDSSVGRIHFIDEGEGVPILFLHGNPTWSFLYRGIVERLRGRFRCVAIDYPGFGLSDHPPGYGYTPAEHAQVVSELVSHLDLKGVTVVGHDWGGPIGMRVALDHVDRLRALVMSNTWYWPADGWLLRAFSRTMSSRLMQSLIVNRNFFVERIVPSAVKDDLPLEVMHHYRGPFPTPSSRAGVAVLPGQITRASFWLGEIAYAAPRLLRDKPLLLPWGVRDIAFTPRFMERFRADFRDVTVRRIDAHHYVAEDAPGEMAEAIEAFLSERAAAA
jgi:haloalkane dehalogenase